MLSAAGEGGEPPLYEGRHSGLKEKGGGTFKGGGCGTSKSKSKTAGNTEDIASWKKKKRTSSARTRKGGGKGSSDEEVV